MDIPDQTPEQSAHGFFIQQSCLKEFGLDVVIICKAIQHTHNILDRIDKTLIDAKVGHKLATLVELANLSAIIGNLFRSGISEASNGVFKANKPHTFPDLLACSPNACDLEIKVALETNKPKGHLIKPGPHIIIRYVLAEEKGPYRRGKDFRGDVAWIWEVRIGSLEPGHFSFSSTQGDSGKTAVINAKGMQSLVPVFIDPVRCPYASDSYTTEALSVGRQTILTGHARNRPPFEHLLSK